MSPVAGSLLTPADIRRRRDALTESELIARCRDAARLEMRGSSYSADDKADVASEVLEQVLVETHGNMPMRDDRRHSLTRYCGKARNGRAKLDERRRKDGLDAELAADNAAFSVDALAADYRPPEAITADDAREVAENACRRIGADDRDVFTLMYRMARDLPTAQIAADLEVSPNAIDLRTARGRRKLRELFPSACELLAALVGEPRTVIEPDGPVLVFSREDRSSEATTHGKTWSGKALREQSARWREGTDAGNWPTRPVDADSARLLCSVRSLPGGRRKHAEHTEQAMADALRNLGRALAA